MLKANFITAEEAAEKIKDGSTVCTIGMTLVSATGQYYTGTFLWSE